ncbi:TetR/AcrR family transcriptional regulator [Micromonospora sp. NPDC050495]|uniref:TetR/AcrR family transcriptional regulator n=1 Tax=Micromonospora sp. NPDC050495 TaxID=3154936 RepID=UPI0033E3AB57
MATSSGIPRAQRGASERPRRRPKDRKQRILAAAAHQFRELGYDHVGMADVAAAVGIGPSALYRHFTGKRELLLAVMTDALGAFETVARAANDQAQLHEGLVPVALNHRDFGLLWERESGHLRPAERDGLWLRLRAIAARVAKLLVIESRLLQETADIRAWAVLSILNSPSHHHVNLGAAALANILRRAVAAVCEVNLPSAVQLPSEGESGPALRPVSRREAVLASAMRLFSERGYPTVSMAEIGAEAGIAGTTLYNHFDSKSDILAAALNRGTEALWLRLHEALRRAGTADRALELVVTDYVSFTVRNTEIIDVLVSEVINLPEEPRDRFRRIQQEYVAEWVALLDGARPQFDEPSSRALVHAALGVANSLPRIRHLRKRPMFVQEVTTLVLGVVHTPLP